MGTGHFRRFLPAALVIGCGLCAASQAFAATLTPNQAYVNLAYHDLLGRDPTAAELNTPAGQLDSNSITRTGFAGGMTSLPEFLGDQVKDYYQNFLNRSADTPGLSGYVTLLQSGATFEQVQGNILSSAEYFTLTGGTNSAFLDALYGDLLNRPIDAPARTAFLGTLTGGGTRQSVADAVLSSAEYRTDLVTSYYNRFLRRTPSPTESGPFITLLGSGAKDQVVINTILASNEYFTLAQSVPEPTAMATGVYIGLLVLRRRRR
jgi:hypothetical protein